jgi:hypothetical protein
MYKRKFLKITGSLAVGGVILSVVGREVWNLFKRPDKLFYDSKRKKGPELLKEDDDFVSPYRRVYGFVVPGDISAMEVEGGSIYIAMPNNISVYGMSGELQTNFSTPSDIRDITVYDGLIYVLFPTRIEVYDRQGEIKQEWEACSANSDYCSLVVCQDGVFVTDAANKNICKYHLDGTHACFIKSPKGFVVPSYCFGITYMDGVIYCSNPGRHQIESYTTEGTFIASFGQSGSEPGAFSGCCNPVVITPSNSGELLTSEKGIPRISCYRADGKFRSVLLDSKALGRGHEAYDVRVMKDKLIVSGGNKVSVFQYDKRVSGQTECGQCDADCPLKM